MSDFRMRSDKPVNNTGSTMFSVGGVYRVDTSPAPPRVVEGTPPASPVNMSVVALADEPTPVEVEEQPKPIPTITSLPAPKRGAKKDE
jgi:hypothetical protein